MKSLICLLCTYPLFLFSQGNLPAEVKITAEGILQHGGHQVEGLYDINQVNKLEITLEEANWFELMDGVNGPGPGGDDDGELLIGTLTYNDELVLDSVLVGIKGQTSDFRNNTEKKSFKIGIDDLKNQDLFGYDNLNLNCAFDDHSSMREVLYYDISRSFAPALKGAFVDLYINGEYWGPYNNIQQLEGSYIKEWFTNNEGTRWRALNSAPTSGGGPGGPGGQDPARFGAGVSSLNYNGPDTTDYNMNYSLKKTNKDNPWEDLIQVCDVLNNTPIDELYETLNPILDIDRTLWILAQEIVFSDDDGYFFKGGMDYYVYWDQATGRLMPLEVDGNSVMADNHLNWSPFYREDDERFPLLNRLLQNPEVRQRYLAHLRTVLAEYFVEEKVHQRISDLAELIDQKVQDDPKKIYSYTEFVNGQEALKDFVTDRIAILNSDLELAQEGITITQVDRVTSDGTEEVRSGEEVFVTAQTAVAAHSVKLYYATGLDGAYNRIEMFDDGLHHDGEADDQVYGATIPAGFTGSYMRYYVEAIKDDAARTASYFPSGAEHQVFIYQVAGFPVEEEVVINEFMASNSRTAADATGAFADWVELYNKGNETIDLTGYHLSDDNLQLDKWTFPPNTTLEPDGYLIIWADGDIDQTTEEELHTNFKLSAGGEMVVLANAAQQIVDEVAYPEQMMDTTYARIPNGIGEFLFRTATFDMNNDGSLSEVSELPTPTDLILFPNPSDQWLNILSPQFSATSLTIYDVTGRIYRSVPLSHTTGDISISISELEPGIYFVHMINDFGQQALGKFAINR